MVARVREKPATDATPPHSRTGRRPRRVSASRRPKTDSVRMFVGCRAPFRPFASHAAVSVIVDRAMRRAGVTPPGRGAAHLLRHSVATSLLRQGASLQDIATTLRHRSIRTTQIYAKVDVSMLDQIAQPWPEVRPC